MLRPQRDLVLNGDMVYQLADYLNEGHICINPIKAMDLADGLLSTLLKPLQFIVEEAMQPLVDQFIDALPGRYDHTRGFQYKCLTQMCC